MIQIQNISKVSENNTKLGQISRVVIEHNIALSNAAKDSLESVLKNVKHTQEIIESTNQEIQEDARKEDENAKKYYCLQMKLKIYKVCL